MGWQCYGVHDCTTIVLAAADYITVIRRKSLNSNKGNIHTSLANYRCSVLPTRPEYEHSAKGGVYLDLIGVVHKGAHCLMVRAPTEEIM